MPRAERFEYADTFYHVLTRGNERRPMFRIERDYVRFCELLETLSDRFEVEVWSYVLMKNHYHLLLRTTRPNLSSAMHWLGVSYSTWFNAKHRRNGHLFQGRFKSFIIEEDDYLERLILYIHRNPLRAKLTERLADYPWSSYRCLAYGRGCASWLRRDDVLSFFDGDADAFRKAVQGYSEERDRLLENIWHSLILGSAEGIDRLRRKDKERPDDRGPRSRKQALDLPIGDVVERFRKTLRIDTQEIDAWRRPVRRSPRPRRDILLRLLWKTGRFRLREIADFFHVTLAAVPFACRRAHAALAENPPLRNRLEKRFNCKL